MIFPDNFIKLVPQLRVFLMHTLNFLKKRLLAQIHYMHVVALRALVRGLVLKMTIVQNYGVWLGAVTALRLLGWVAENGLLLLDQSFTWRLELGSQLEGVLQELLGHLVFLRCKGIIAREAIL